MNRRSLWPAFAMGVGLLNLAVFVNAKEKGAPGLTGPDMSVKPVWTLEQQSRKPGDRFFLQPNHIMFSPDDKRLAGTGPTGRIHLWDAATGKEVWNARADMTRLMYLRIVWDVAFSPDGSQLASAQIDKTITLWDAATGRSLHVIQDAAANSHRLAFSPDGRRLASGGNDGTVRLWDLGTRKEVVALHGHQQRVGALAFRPDGKMLASAGLDGTARLWDLGTAAEARCWKTAGAVKYVTFSPDGTQIAWAGERSVISDAASGKQVLALPGGGAIQFSPDGKRVAAERSGKPGELVIYDAKTGQPWADLGPADATDIAFSPDGKRVAAISNDYGLKLWDLGNIGHQ